LSVDITYKVYPMNK